MLALGHASEREGGPVSEEERAERAAAYIEGWNRGLGETGPPIHGAMGITIISLLPTTIVEIELSEVVRGMLPGSIHGGMVATLIDVASAICVWESFDSAVEHPATTDLQVRYFRQPKAGPVRCEAEVVHAGRRILSTAAKVTDGEGRLLASATASFALVERRW